MGFTRAQHARPRSSRWSRRTKIISAIGGAALAGSAALARRGRCVVLRQRPRGTGRPAGQT
jgi:hypothetical protein